MRAISAGCKGPRTHDRVPRLHPARLVVSGNTAVIRGTTHMATVLSPRLRAPGTCVHCARASLSHFRSPFCILPFRGVQVQAPAGGQDRSLSLTVSNTQASSACAAHRPSARSMEKEAAVTRQHISGLNTQRIMIVMAVLATCIICYLGRFRPTAPLCGAH